MIIMESEIINIFNSICDKLNIAYQFTAENVQYVLNRYGQYLFVLYCSSTVSLLLVLLFLVFIALATCKSYRNETWAYDYGNLSIYGFVCILILAITFPTTMIAFFAFFTDTLQAAITPDLFAAEKIIQMIIN